MREGYEWLTKLKPGDRVAVRQTGWATGLRVGIVKAVTKQNGGTIVVGTTKFDMCGSERGHHGFQWDILEELTPRSGGRD